MPVEVSIQQARVWHLFRTTEGWVSTADLVTQTGVSPRAARAYTKDWCDQGLLERQEVFPRHLYRLAPVAKQQYARAWTHLDTCTQLLLSRLSLDTTRQDATGHDTTRHDQP